MVSMALLWKNGPLSAASTSGGTLKVPSPGVRNPSSRGTLWPVSRAGWSGRSSTPVLKLAFPRLPPPKFAVAPAFTWQRLHLPSLLSRKIAWPRLGTVPLSLRGMTRSCCRPRDNWKASRASSSSSVGRRKSTPGARHRGPETEHVRDPPHDELVLEVVEPVKVFENQSELPHQRRVLEVLLQGWGELGDEEGIVLRERRDEGRVDGEVILRRMAGAAGTPVAGERLVEEEVSSLRDELGLRIWGRWSGLTAREPDDAQENRRNQHHSGNRAQRSHAQPTERAPRAGERHGQSIGEFQMVSRCGMSWPGYRSWAGGCGASGYRDYRVVGTAIVEDDRVWMSCTCRAVTRELS